MPEEFVHLRPNKLNTDSNLLLLAIPAVVFFLVLTFLAWRWEGWEMSAGPNQTAVLGEEGEAGK